MTVCCEEIFKVRPDDGLDSKEHGAGVDKYFVSRECSLYKSPVAGKCRAYSRSRKKCSMLKGQKTMWCE